MSEPAAVFEYHLFISYSTRSDYRLARHLESFIESFHRTRTGKSARLPALQVCLDGSDFVVSAEDRQGVERGSTAAPVKVPEVIERHLTRCRQLLVLCSPESMQSQWVKDEIRFFLDRYGAGRVLLALTHGKQAETEPEQFFAPELAAEGLHETVWFDLRGFYRKERHQPTLRDFDSERLRLVASLHDKPASAIETLWSREQKRAAKFRYTVGAAVAIVTIVLGSTLYVQRRVAREQTLRAGVQESMQYVSQAYRYRYADPFAAAVKAYQATRIDATRQTEDEIASAFEATHRVLVERRRIALQERTVVKAGGFSFVSQATSGQRYTKLSKDGERALVVTERRGGLFSPEFKGDAYVLNNRTLEIVELTGCEASTDYRLEFADFVGLDKVLIARAFHVDLYTVDGKCLGSFQLQHTKTPVTAAGGMLYDVFFAAGNGAGCVWVEEYGNQGLVKPSRELSVVTSCDEKYRADAVVRILVDPQGRLSLNLFQSGRVDLFALDGRNGRPKRRAVLAGGGFAAAFRPGERPPSFALAYADAESGRHRLARWDVVSNEPGAVGDFILAPDSPPIDYLGFSADGDYLVGLDTKCSLHIWEYETRSHQLTRLVGAQACR